MRSRGPTNPYHIRLIRLLYRQGRNHRAPIWTRVAEFLEKPRRTRVAVNLGQINRHISDGDVVVVPGKLLGSGELTHPVTIAAFKISDRARVKVEKNGGRLVPLERLVEEHPSGARVKLLT